MRKLHLASPRTFLLLLGQVLPDRLPVIFCAIFRPFSSSNDCIPFFLRCPCLPITKWKVNGTSRRNDPRKMGTFLRRALKEPTFIAAVSSRATSKRSRRRHCWALWRSMFMLFPNVCVLLRVHYHFDFHREVLICCTVNLSLFKLTRTLSEHFVYSEQIYRGDAHFGFVPIFQNFLLSL